MLFLPAGDFPGNPAFDLAASYLVADVAAVCDLDFCSGIGGICGSLPERLAPGVAESSAHLFHDLIVVHYFWR